jgi:serine/threonine protein kinase
MSHPTLLELQPRPVPQLGGYRLLEVLGQGGMGTVYLAARAGTDEAPRLCALKVLRPELSRDARHVAMFRREADLAVRLRHPNVVQTLEVGESEGRAFLAMEFLDGQPFHLLLGRPTQTPALPLDARVQIVCNALQGLHYVHQLHDAGRPLHPVHRDVSPNNVFVTYGGQVKLLDFGVTKLATHGDTGSADFKGKLGYAAPERFLHGPVDVRSDVFAAGVTLWEAIALRRFASGPPTRAYVDARMHGRELSITQVVPDVDRELAAICNRALQVDPERRFPSAEALRRALQNYLVKRRAELEPAALGRWVQHLFGTERNALHQRINTHLRLQSDPKQAPCAAPRVAAQSFIRRRPATGMEAVSTTPARRVRRHVLWLLTLLMLALLAAAVHAST